MTHNFSNVDLLFCFHDSIASDTSLVCIEAAFQTPVYRRFSTTAWSLAWFSISLVLCTATGLFSTSNLAIFNAFSNAFSLVSSTSLMNPVRRASWARNGRALRQTSLTQLKLPTILGSRERVPRSAAIPMSTSLTENLASAEQMRMSAQEEMSTAIP